jgi:hypothetical protein
VLEFELFPEMTISVTPPEVPFNALAMRLKFLFTPLIVAVIVEPGVLLLFLQEIIQTVSKVIIVKLSILFIT